MHRLGYVFFPGASVMTFAVIAAFETANQLRGSPFYDLKLISETGGPVRSSAGMEVSTTRWGNGALDTLMVGGDMALSRGSPALIRFVKAAPRKCRRIAAICTGAFILAEAGLLDGRRATTHWQAARRLQADYPHIKVEADCIFIEDGPIWSSAGMSAGIDLALALIERDLGPDLARATARKLVLYHRRAGGQSQYSELLALDAKSDRIQKALGFARRNLKKPLGVAELAAAASLSPRQFSRAFQAETGQSPAKALENLRVEAARLMMEEGNHPIDVVARETGFADRNRMRRAFLRAFGQPPQTIRRLGRMQA